MLVICTLRFSTTALSDSVVVWATPDITRKADGFVSSVSGCRVGHTVVGGSTAGGGASGLDSSCGDGGDRNGDTADEIDEMSQNFVLG